MKRKSILQASFEESLNLEDDTASSGFITRNLKETQEKEKYRGTLKSYIWLVILTVLFIYGPNWLLYVGSGYIFGHVENKLIQPAVYNFLPNWVFMSLGIIWLVLILIGKKFYQQFILIYRGQFHLFVTYFLWLLIEWNLFCLTGFYSTLGLLGTISFLIVDFYLVYLIIKGRLKNLINLVYGGAEEAGSKVNTIISKIVNYFMIFLGLFSVLWLFVKSFLNFKVEVGSWLGVLGLIALWFFVNILFAFYESYIILPFMLRGFYRLKYPEEYREWEGKTLEEWYGKKYLKKHKELLKNESN
ncbi:hypothetical protein ACVRXS_11820 [Streptococcus orisratti]|uniref:hypothetical protein n=1 Tax=Streptococcus orisratti TaxID=114652 RepID=UPI000373815A|nr:hypothetical protein [Streptococcus orisratti]